MAAVARSARPFHRFSFQPFYLLFFPLFLKKWFKSYGKWLRRAFKPHALLWRLCSNSRKWKKAIRCNHRLQSCQTLFRALAFIRRIDKYEYLVPERELRKNKSNLPVHGISIALAVIFNTVNDTLLCVHASDSSPKFYSHWEFSRVFTV